LVSIHNNIRYEHHSRKTIWFLKGPMYCLGLRNGVKFWMIQINLFIDGLLEVFNSLIKFLIIRDVFTHFVSGVLNTCYNCLDIHISNGRGNQIALIYDSPVTVLFFWISYTYHFNNREDREMWIYWSKKILSKISIFKLFLSGSDQEVLVYRIVDWSEEIRTCSTRSQCEKRRQSILFTLFFNSTQLIYTQFWFWWKIIISFVIWFLMIFCLWIDRL
jgi:hypothetical protein